MSFRSTLVLIILLALVGGALYVVNQKPEPQGPGLSGKSDSPWPASTQPRDLNAFKLINMDRNTFSEMAFKRENSIWYMTMPRKDRADQARVDYVLGALTSNRWRLVGPAADLERKLQVQMGLADQMGNPSGRGYLEFILAGESFKVWLGGPDVDDNYIFVRVQDRVWRTNVNLWSGFAFNIADYRSPRVFALPLGHICRVKIERAFANTGTPAEVLELEMTGKDRWTLKEGEVISRAGPKAVRGLLTYLQRLEVGTVVGDLEPPLSHNRLDPPFFRVTVASRQQQEIFHLGKCTDDGILCYVDSRPYLLEIAWDSITPLMNYLKGRGLKTYGEGVDFRFRHPLSFPPHKLRGLRVHREGKFSYEIVRSPKGDFNLVKPWQRALLDGRVKAFTRELLAVQASSSYTPTDRPLSITGLDKPRLQVEIKLAGTKDPVRLAIGNDNGKGSYVGVSGESKVFFVLASRLAELVPEPLDLISRLIQKKRPADFSIVTISGLGKTHRFARDQGANAYRTQDGAPVGDAFEDLLDTVIELQGSAAVSTGADQLHNSPDTVEIGFHRSLPEGNDQEPGQMMGRLWVAKQGEHVLVTGKDCHPFVFKVPGRIWSLIEKVLAP